MRLGIARRAGAPPGRGEGQPGDRRGPVSGQSAPLYRLPDGAALRHRPRAAPGHRLRQHRQDRMPALHGGSVAAERPRQAGRSARRRQRPRGDYQAPPRPALGRRRAGDGARHFVHLEGRERPERRVRRHSPVDPRNRGGRAGRQHGGAAPAADTHLLRAVGRAAVRTRGRPRLDRSPGARGLHQPHRLQPRPAQPRAVGRAVHRLGLPVQQQHRFHPERALARPRPRAEIHHPAADREHGGAAGQPALRRRGHDPLRHRPVHRPGNRPAEIHRRPLPLHLQAATQPSISRRTRPTPSCRTCASAKPCSAPST